MKKLLALILAAALALSLAACGGSKSGNNGDASTQTPGQDPNSMESPSTEDEEPEPQADPLILDEVNTAEGVAEYRIVTAYVTDDVMPPKPDMIYTHYAADSGKVYVVLIMDLKNLQTESISADDLMNVTLDVGESTYRFRACLVEEDGGEKLDQYGDVDAQSTERVYYLFSIPEDSDTEHMTLTVTAGEDVRAADIGIQQFLDRRPAITLGEEITDGETFSITVDEVYFADSLYPPQASGYYHYFEADDGKMYLIAKVTAKNLNGSDMKYSDIAAVSCVYDGTYNYSAFGVLARDGGADLSAYPEQYSISPLDSGVMYYLAEVPAEAEQGSVELVFYMLGDYYTYSIGE